jgi:lycopene cyclase domain-containing protein
MKYLYLFVNLGAVIIPFIFSFHKKLRFDKKWKAFFTANLISITPFLIWDSIFTNMRIWGFNPDYLSGFYFGNLPIEEVLFFVCIPYACVYTWHCLTIIKWQKGYIRSLKFLDYLFISGSLIVSIVFNKQLYTSFTFLALAVLILILKLLKRSWLSSFYFTYFILLIPFTIVNGILTGTGIESQIVWYNNNHIIGYRVLTIPIEDIFYGMTLILLHISLFEWLKKKF